MAVLKNRAGVATATPGTGTVTLGSALGAISPFLASWRTFADAGVTDGQIVRYLILDSNGAWEYGTGTYTAAGTTLSRTLGGSSTGALLNLSGNAQVFVAAIDEDIIEKIVGPASATDNAIIRYDGATGKLVQDSAVIIDDSGALLSASGASVGHSALIAQGVVTRKFQVHAVGATTSGMMLGYWSNDLQGPYIDYTKSRGAIGNYTIVVDGDTLGAITFKGSDGTQFRSAALIYAAVDGTPGANDMPGRLLFNTRPAGSTFEWERMRINSAGQISVLSAGLLGLVDAKFNIFSSGSERNLNLIGYDVSGFAGPTIRMMNTKGAAPATQAAVASGDFLGGPEWYGSDGTGFIQAAAIYSSVDGAVATNDMPGRLTFWTTLDGAATATERMRIDNAGRVNIGRAAGASLIQSSNPRFEVANDATTQVTARFHRYSADTNPAQLFLSKSRGGTPDTNTILQSGDAIGAIHFYGANGNTDYTLGATIVAKVDGATGEFDQPGRLEFHTTPDGSDFPAERMRIDNAGLVSIGNSGSTGHLSIGAITALSLSGIAGRQQIVGNGNNEWGIAQVSVGNNAFGLDWAFYKTRHSTDPTSHTIVAANDELWGMYAHGSDGAAYQRAAQVSFYVDGTPAAGDMPGRIAFKTTPAGSTSVAERMRIDNAGRSWFNSGAGVSYSVESTFGLANLGVNTAVDWGLQVFAYSNNAFGPSVVFGKTRGANLSTGVAVQNNDELGLFIFSGLDSNLVSKQAAAVLIQVDGTVGADDMPGRMIFKTTPGGSSTPVERLRIRSDGTTATFYRLEEAAVTLTDAATVALNAALGNVFDLLAAGDRTIDVPTNKPASGRTQKIIIRHKASAADRTLTLTTGSAGAFRFGSTITGLTVTASGKTDHIGCVYNAADDRWDVVAYTKGH